MERQSFDQDEVQLQRNEAVLGNMRLRFGIDHYYTEVEDLPTRQEMAPGSALKLFDDVLMPDGVAYRVVAPAMGRDNFTAYGVTSYGPLTTTWSVRDVQDRAPADPQEQAMPVVAPLEPPEEPEPEEPTPEQMAALRFSAFSLIDAYSDAMFASGFLFKGVLLSLSLEAQARYTNMDYQRSALDPLGNPVLTYPLVFSSLDDTTTVTLDSADDLHFMYLTAFARVAEIVLTGNAEKNYIRDPARTAEELRTYRDTRPLPSIIPPEP